MTLRGDGENLMNSVSRVSRNNDAPKATGRGRRGWSELRDGLDSVTGRRAAYCVRQPSGRPRGRLVVSYIGRLSTDAPRRGGNG